MGVSLPRRRHRLAKGPFDKTPDLGPINLSGRFHLSLKFFSLLILPSAIHTSHSPTDFLLLE
jgi:hypothetical protein